MPLGVYRIVWEVQELSVVKAECLPFPGPSELDLDLENSGDEREGCVVENMVGLWFLVSCKILKVDPGPLLPEVGPEYGGVMPILAFLAFNSRPFTLI